MEKIRCISLCEVLFKVKIDKLATSDFIEKTIRLSGNEKVDRVYIGSNFCGRYFLNCPDSLYGEVAEYCKEKNIAVTLVVPTFSQRDLEGAKRRIGGLLALNIDEVTVNDYGMLDYVASNFSVKVNLGRLFNKDARDQRYFTFTDSEKIPDLLTIDNMATDRYKINAIEFDVTNSVLDFNNSKYECAVYTPYVYNTYGNICEYASIGKNIDKKFRTNDSCSCQCMSVNIDYSFSGNFKYYKFGRAIYFKHGDYTVKGCEKVREIFQPFDLLKGGENE